MPHRRIVLPLDVATYADADALAAKLAREVGVLKVGLELFTAIGPQAIELGATHSIDLFLDLKLHDIPETVERAVKQAVWRGVRYLTVHASGGRAMLERAVKAAGERTMILAVTVLTSLDDGDLRSMGVARTTAEHALELARLAWDSGVRGFVCSPLEIASIRREFPSAKIVVPGVRPSGTSNDDQRRVATPARAIEDGADLLVIGRPIRDAVDPVAAARSIAVEIGDALKRREGA